MYAPEPNLNTPPESGAGRKLRRQAQHAAIALDVGTRQGLGEDVSDLHVCWDEHWRDRASLDDVATASSSASRGASCDHGALGCE